MLTKETIQKLVLQCHHPRTVPNRYTRELITVPCGTCPACLLRKSNLRTALLMNWASNYKYRFFVTLTYKNEFLPTFKIIPAEVSSDEEADTYCFNNVNPDTRIMYVAKQVPRRYSVKVKDSTIWRSFNQDKDSVESFWFYSTPKEMQVYFNKIKYPVPFRIPFVNYRDVDLFLKRLRSYYKNENEEFKYYSTSEYGPVHLRPHYHFLILTDSEYVAGTLAQNIHKAWFYGRTDCELSRGFCAGYVASYINNDVSLPRLYQLMPKSARPQSHHSKGWQESNLFPDHSLPCDYERMFSICLDGIDATFNGDIQSIRPSWAYINRVFPRFGDSVRNNPSCISLLLGATLTASKRVCRRTGSIDVDFFKGSLSRFCELYALYASLQYSRYRSCKMTIVERTEFVRTDLMIINECRLARDVEFLSAYVEPDSVSIKCGYVCSFYRHFLRCRKFFDFWRINSVSLDSNGIYHLSNWIGDFWKSYDYKRLRESFMFMESVVSVDALKYIYRMYSDCRAFPPEKNTESEFVSSIIGISSQRIQDKCKHKELNDANNILFNQFN